MFKGDTFFSVILHRHAINENLSFYKVQVYISPWNKNQLESLLIYIILSLTRHNYYLIIFTESNECCTIILESHINIHVIYKIDMALNSINWQKRVNIAVGT